MIFTKVKTHHFPLAFPPPCKELSRAFCLCSPWRCGKGWVNARGSLLGLPEGEYGEPFPRSWILSSSKHFLYTCPVRDTRRGSRNTTMGQAQPYHRCSLPSHSHTKRMGWRGSGVGEWTWRITLHLDGLHPEEWIKLSPELPSLPHQYP